MPDSADPRRWNRSRRETADHLIHHDNTFGTPEEDAFRRDFTVNALFYDIATFSIIDYVGGLEDLRAGLVRSIGDPEVRFREDPVRMMRAVALAARLDFAIDQPSLDAIHIHRHEISRSSPPRLLEEYYKILRGRIRGTDVPPAGEARAPGTGFRGAPSWCRRGALAIARGARRLPPPVRIDAGHAHQRHPAGQLDRTARPGRSAGARRPVVIRARARPRPGERPGTGFQAAANRRDRLRPGGPRLGELPLARRDVERLRQILGLQRRLRDLTASPRARKALTHRSIFREALTWLDIHGAVPEIVEQWRVLLADTDTSAEIVGEEGPPEAILPRRRRRRRRRRYRPTP